MLFFTSVLHIIFISFWLIFESKNGSKSYLKSVKKLISGLRCPWEAPRPPQGCPRWSSGLHFRAFWGHQEAPRSPQGCPRWPISGLLEVPWPPLSAIGTTFGALLPIRELVLNILGTACTYLRKRIQSNKANAFRSILAQVWDGFLPRGGPQIDHFSSKIRHFFYHAFKVDFVSKMVPKWP